MNIVKWFPNILTLANLVSGCLAIVWCLQGRVEYVAAALAACLAFDFFDGLAARGLKAYHPIGGQLDSLADMVSFGAAPGIILVVLLQSMGISETWSYLGLLFPAAAAVRLARFNLDERPGNDFFGLPSPAAAIYVYGLYLSQAQDPCTLCIGENATWPLFVLISTLLMAVLMITDLRHFGFKTLNPGSKKGKFQLVLVVLSFVLIFLLQWEAISSIIVLYIFLSLAYYNLKGVDTNEISS